MYCDEMIMKQVAKSKGENKAGKYEGEYYVSIKGNSIHVDDLMTWDYGESKCDPQDKFDVGEGVKVAMDRLIERREGIKVGDKVTLKTAASYNHYAEWVTKNIKDANLAAHFAFGGTPRVDAVYTVKAIANHANKFPLAYIQSDEELQFGACYLMNLESLKKVD